MAQATLLLAHQPRAKIVVFQTDGSDNPSRYTLPDLRKMNVSERILVYDIGLGRVNEEELGKLASATGGLQSTTFLLFKYSVKHSIVKTQQRLIFNHRLMNNRTVIHPVKRA